MTVNVIHAIGWPIVALAGIVVLWRSGFLAELGRRSTKISVFQVSLELVTVSQNELPGLEQLRDPVATGQVQSGTESLMQQLLQPNDVDYVVIDLRAGQRWLASRLYLFAELLRRQRRLRCIVFVERRDAVSERLIGIADPLDVRAAMVARFPWLELALNDAYSQAFALFRPISFSRPEARLEPQVAETVASNFLSHPNISWTENAALDYRWSNFYGIVGLIPAPWIADPTGKLQISDQREWNIVHDQPKRYEHARWLTGAYLGEVMGRQFLHEDDWLVAEPGQSEEQRVLDVLARSGDFVALVNSERSFRRLIERRLVLEEVARREVRRASQSRS